MGIRGPVGQSEKIRKLRGNAGKRQGKKDVQVDAVTALEAPDWLDGRGLYVWRRLEPLLTRDRILAAVDADALGLLCDVLADYINCKQVLAKKGRTYKSTSFSGEVRIRVRPEVMLAAEAWKRARQMMQDFGMTAASRGRVKPIEAPDGDDEVEGWFGNANTA